MSEKQEKMFFNINEWLKFAEAKHAGIIVFISGILFGTLEEYKVYKYIPGMKTCVKIEIVLLAIALLLSLISFFPKLGKIPTKKTNSQLEKNLWFFKDTSEMTVDDFIGKYDKMYPNKVSINENDKYLIAEIIINSKITLKKYKYFDWVLIILLIALAVPFVNILCYILRK